MRQGNAGARVISVPVTTATNATQSQSFSRAGYDHANIMILVGTHATDGAPIGTITISESNTVTSPSSMTDIVAFTGGTATSTSVGFVIPGAAATGPGALLEFHMDLQKRKKYIGIEVTPGTTTMNIGIITQLTRGNVSDDTAAQKSAVTNNNLTSATQCALLHEG